MSDFNHKSKKKPRPDAEHYVDNEKFYDELKKYKAEIRKAEAEGRERPIINDYIAECFIKIANKLSNHHKFNGYPFKDQMISDGIENCFRYAYKFDESYKNPFAYYTMIQWRAFVRRIKAERKYLYRKYSIIQKHLMHDMFEEDTILMQQKYGNEYTDENMNEFMYKYEEGIEREKRKKAENAKKKKKTNIDKALESDDKKS